MTDSLAFTVTKAKLERDTCAPRAPVPRILFKISEAAKVGSPNFAEPAKTAEPCQRFLIVITWVSPPAQKSEKLN